ncbi:hypothetical protein [Streptomyces iakyrus]|uniref:hypothetical protein n=1 Tax=Streptomyces iakyrus TaxID=68219 RepID=UPI0036975160
MSASDDTITDRISTVSIATLVLSFFVATASAGLTAAANVLDRRRVYGLLRLSGTPLKVLDRARVRETALPLAALAGGTTAMGVFAPCSSTRRQAPPSTAPAPCNSPSA